VSKPRAYKFETDHFENVVWPALAHRFPQFKKTSARTPSRASMTRRLDGNPIIGPWEGKCENFYGLVHAPATGQAIAELILHRHFQTLDLTRLGWKQVAENRPFPKQGII
jgi:FAD-dependent oxidoreductase domain-containing protein 1